jgi:hypothetical protein
MPLDEFISRRRNSASAFPLLLSFPLPPATRRRYVVCVTKVECSSTFCVLSVCPQLGHWQDVSFDSMHGSIPVLPDTLLSLTAHGRATEIVERLYR